MTRTLIRFMLAIFVGTLCVLMLAPGISSAQDGTPPETLAEIRLSALSVMVLTSLVIPIATGLLTKITVPSGVKSIVTLVLNAVSALVVSATMQDGTAVLSQNTLIMFVLGLVVSIASYLGVYKPNGLTSSEADGKLAPTRGVG